MDHSLFYLNFKNNTVFPFIFLRQIPIFAPSGLQTIPTDTYDDIMDNVSCTFEIDGDITVTLTRSEDKNAAAFKAYRDDHPSCEGTGVRSSP